MNLADYLENVVRPSYGWKIPVLEDHHLPARPSLWDMWLFDTAADGSRRWEEWQVGHVISNPGYVPCTFFHLAGGRGTEDASVSVLFSCECRTQRCPGPGPLYGQSYSWLPLWGELTEARARLLEELKLKWAKLSYSLVFGPDRLPVELEKLILSH